jgi:molybdopterin synthase sulfur carrier subunit
MVSLSFNEQTINHMSIQVKFFASLKDKVGQSEVQLDSAATADDAWALATDNADKPANLLVAINLEYADFSTPLKAGDEVAFFPPVTGG